ncbi:MAG: hypothetical protein PF542_03015 [Nanoarchaeota archaeon]|jgi:hypothetical protein|nr:hypothetical protein [Nanoarchaeota archaeon]
MRRLESSKILLDVNITPKARTIPKEEAEPIIKKTIHQQIAILKLRDFQEELTKPMNYINPNSYNIYHPQYTAN